MYRGLSVIAIVPVFNEAVKIGEVVRPHAARNRG